MELLTEKVFTEKPPLVVEYELTDFGKTLLPVLEAITKWGEESRSSQKNNQELKFLIIFLLVQKTETYVSVFSGIY